MKIKEFDAWITRDKDYTLTLFVEDKPIKTSFDWLPQGNYFTHFKSEYFPEVKWEDKEPTKVKLTVEKV